MGRNTIACDEFYGKLFNFIFKKQLLRIITNIFTISTLLAILPNQNVL